MRDIIRAAKSLSDETRLRILNLLLERECCVCEVMQVLEISQTRASRNLNMLYDAGFLKVRREGLWAYYSIDESSLQQCLSLFMKAVGLGLKGNKVAALDREHLKEAQRLGPRFCGQSECPVSSNGARKAREEVKTTRLNDLTGGILAK